MINPDNVTDRKVSLFARAEWIERRTIVPQIKHKLECDGGLIFLGGFLIVITSAPAKYVLVTGEKVPKRHG